MASVCTRCGTIDASPIQAAECGLRSAYLDDLVAAAAVLDRPATPPQTADLFAHLCTVYGDGAMAHRAVRTVLDLGWRPTGMSGQGKQQ